MSDPTSEIRVRRNVWITLKVWHKLEEDIGMARTNLEVLLVMSSELHLGSPGYLVTNLVTKLVIHKFTPWSLPPELCQFRKKMHTYPKKIKKNLAGSSFAAKRRGAVLDEPGADGRGEAGFREARVTRGHDW